MWKKPQLHMSCLSIFTQNGLKNIFKNVVLLRQMNGQILKWCQDIWRTKACWSARDVYKSKHFKPCSLSSFFLLGEKAFAQAWKMQLHLNEVHSHVYTKMSAVFTVQYTVNIPKYVPIICMIHAKYLLPCILKST